MEILAPNSNVDSYRLGSGASGLVAGLCRISIRLPAGRPLFDDQCPPRGGHSLRARARPLPARVPERLCSSKITPITRCSLSSIACAIQPGRSSTSWLNNRGSHRIRVLTLTQRLATTSRKSLPRCCRRCRRFDDSREIMALLDSDAISSCLVAAGIGSARWRTRG